MIKLNTILILADDMTQCSDALIHLYLAYTFPLSPLYANADVIALYDGAANMDWDEIRMAIYLAIIKQTDREIGKMLETREAKNQLVTTLILFLSENGDCTELLAADGWARFHPRQNLDGTVVRVDNGLNFSPGSRETFMSYVLHWGHEGDVAICAGEWKQVRRHDQPLEHYQMDDDRTEHSELAAGEKARTIALSWDHLAPADSAGVCDRSTLSTELHRQWGTEGAR